MFRITLFFIVFLTLNLITACGASPDTTTPNPTTTYQESFIYKPAGGLTQRSPSITHVYLCGTFNNWNQTSHEMTWNPTNNQFERQLQLENGSYQYKYRVVYSSGSSFLFADPTVANSVTDEGWGYNSVRILPSTTPTLYTISCTFTNAQQFWIGLAFTTSQSENWEDFDSAKPAHNTFSWQRAAIGETSHQYTLDLGSADSAEDISINRFHYIRRPLSTLTQNIVLSTPECSYSNSLLSPSTGVHSKDSIDFSWAKPQNIGTITNINLVITSTFGEYVWMEGISTTATNFHFNGDTAITGGGRPYLWGVRFFSDSGWIYTSRLASIILN